MKENQKTSLQLVVGLFVLFVKRLSKDLGPVVRKAVSGNPGLKVKRGLISHV